MLTRTPPTAAVTIATPTAPPHWALLERELMRAIEAAIPPFYDRYFDERGYLKCFARWGALDGPDDAAENVTNWTDFYALGGSERVLALYRRGIEGHIRQYTEAKTTVTKLGADGMYYKEFPTAFDWVHNGEGYHCLFQEGLCEPWNLTWRQRICRFAGFYLPGDPDEPAEPNYDPKHRIIRSVLNGSRGPVLGRAEPVDWAGDPFEIEGRFKPGRGHRDFDDYLFHFETYRDVEGDIPLNLATTAMAFYAYAATGDPRYKEWIEEYSDAWIERTYANDGLIPGNVGLDGQVGGGLHGGDWWRGVYGWGHTGGFYGLDEDGKPIPHHRPNFQHRTPYAFGNALLVSATGSTWTSGGPSWSRSTRTASSRTASRSIRACTTRTAGTTSSRSRSTAARWKSTSGRRTASATMRWSPPTPGCGSWTAATTDIRWRSCRPTWKRCAGRSSCARRTPARPTCCSPRTQTASIRRSCGAWCSSCWAAFPPATWACPGTARCATSTPNAGARASRRASPRWSTT